MLKNLLVAAILLASSIADASQLNPEDAQYDNIQTIFKSKEASTASKPLKKNSSSSSSSSSSVSSSSSDSDSSSSGSSSSSSSSSGSSTSTSNSDYSSSDSDSSSLSSDNWSRKIVGVKKFKKKHGKKWLKSYEKAKEHDIALIRHVREIDPSPKGMCHKSVGKAKYAFVKKTLKLKSKNPIRITVNTNGIWKGLTVRDGDKKLFKVKNHEYIIVKKGEHAISVVANKKGVEGTATIKVEEVKPSKEVAKKYKFIAATVKARDAQDLCERFGGNLAVVKEKDIEKIVEAAKKMVNAGFDQVWIERVINESDDYSYLPYVLDLNDGGVVADPDRAYACVAEYGAEKLASIAALKESNKKKYKKALAKVHAKIRKHMDKLLDVKDNTTARAVLCSFG